MICLRRKKIKVRGEDKKTLRKGNPILGNGFWKD